MQQSGVADGSAISRDSRACKHKRSSVGGCPGTTSKQGRRTDRSRHQACEHVASRASGEMRGQLRGQPVDLVSWYRGATVLRRASMP
jgi:hypothetical protein